MKEWVIGILTIIVSILGVILVIIQWNKNKLYKRSEFVEPLIKKIREDSRIVNVIYALEYSDLIAYKCGFNINGNSNNLHLKNIDKCQLEMDVDYTLATLSYICYLSKNRVLEESDMIFFEYKIMCCLQSQAIVDYLEFIFSLANSFDTNTTHLPLIEFGIEKGFLSKEKFESRKER